LNYRVLIVVFVIIVLGVQTSHLSDAEYVHSNITVKPEARMGHAMVFDPHNDVAVIFGGASMEGEHHLLGGTWIYSYTENSWTELVLTPSPPSDDNTVMVYCNETNEIIFYGGDADPSTWSFDCENQAWSRVITSASPGFRDSHAMAYDPQENVVILFGGLDGEGGAGTSDLWKFDCSSREWTELFPETRPLARYGHVMVYDESINRIVLTCGNAYPQGYQDDTWICTTSTNNWTELTPIGTPDALKWASMTYDSVNQKCILFGGVIGADAVNYTWIYDATLNTWSRRYPIDAPADRFNTGLAFDSNNDVAILFGGCSDGLNAFDDTWAYSYESNVWTNMEGDSDTTTTGLALDPMLPALALSIGVAVIIVTLILRRRTRDH